MQFSNEFLNKWEHIIEEVNKTEIPLECIKKVVIRLHGKKVYVRYIGEQHVKEDCNGYIPSAKEWVDNINKPTEWMIKTLKIED